MVDHNPVAGTAGTVVTANIGSMVVEIDPADYIGQDHIVAAGVHIVDIVLVAHILFVPLEPVRQLGYRSPHKNVRRGHFPVHNWCKSYLQAVGQTLLRPAYSHRSSYRRRLPQVLLYGKPGMCASVAAMARLLLLFAHRALSHNACKKLHLV